jgi:hypothetical protein
MMQHSRDKTPLSPIADLQERHSDEIRWFGDFLDRHPGLHDDRSAFSATLQRAVGLGVSVEELRRVFEIDRSTAWRWIEGPSTPGGFLRKQVIGWIRDQLPQLTKEGGGRRVSRRSAMGKASPAEPPADRPWIDAAPKAVRRVLEFGGISDVYPPGVMILVEAKVFVDGPPHERRLSFMGRDYVLDDTGERKRELVGCRPLDALAWIQAGYDRNSS